MNDKPVMKQMDTAAVVPALPEEITLKIPGLQTDSFDILIDYNGRLPVVGSAKVTVKYEKKFVKDLVVTIVKNNSEPLVLNG